MAVWSQMNIQDQWFDTNGDPLSGGVLKAYDPGGLISTSIAIDSTGASPQASITLNANGQYEVGGSPVLPFIDRTHKWGIFANATDAAADTPFFAGPFDNVSYSGDDTEDDLLALKIIPPVATYAALRALASSTLTDASTVNVTGDGIAGQFVVKTGTVTDNGGTLIVFNDDSNRYMERAFDYLISPLWSEANNDGVTSDSSLLNTLNSSNILYTHEGNYGIDSPLLVINDYIGGTFTYNGGVAQAFNFNLDNTSISGATIVSDKHGLQHTNLTRGNDLTYSKITSDGYGVLVNDSSNGSSKMRVAFCDIFSDTADAVELNNPTRGSSGYMILGNWLHADVNGTSSNSGFSVGIAGIDGHITAFNRSTESREEAYHVEDTQYLGIQIGNIWDGCLKDGSFIGGQFESQPTSDGLVSIGNRYRHTGSLGASVGLHYRFPTSNGQLDMCTGVGNYTSGFGTGIKLPSKSLSYHGGNVVAGSTTAVHQLLSSVCIGDNISKGATTLFEGEGASLVGGVHSKEKPTNVVVNSGVASQIGSAIKRFSWKTAYTHAGGATTELFDLFASGDLIQGKLSCILQNGTSNFIISADVTWDGTTFTELNKVRRNYGNIGGTLFYQENAGRIEISVYLASGTITAGNLIVDFDGVYFVQ